MMLKKCIRKLFLLIILFGGLHVISTALGCEPCEFSVFTETEVDTCPETEDELIRRKAEKKCETLANYQNCSEPEKFKYHCAIDEHENKLIEVCAKEHRINGGRCTEYNNLGKTIQEHQILKCRTFKPTCPPTYLSSEAYLCNGCHDLVKLQKNGSCSTEPQDFSNAMNNSNNTNERTNSDSNESLGCRCNFKVHVIVIIIAAVEFVIIILMCIIKKARKQTKAEPGRKMDIGDEEFNLKLSVAENSP